MARQLEKHDESAEVAREASLLRDAINTHLYNPDNKLYYLNIDVEGQARTDVTCDLVFPVIFGVADDDTAARIVSRLSSDDFWTEAGLRTVPRDAPNYGPTHGYGLLGGVWVGLAFWYASRPRVLVPNEWRSRYHRAFATIRAIRAATTPCRASSPSGCMARRSSTKG